MVITRLDQLDTKVVDMTDDIVKATALKSDLAAFGEILEKKRSAADLSTKHLDIKISKLTNPVTLEPLISCSLTQQVQLVVEEEVKKEKSQMNSQMETQIQTYHNTLTTFAQQKMAHIAAEDKKQKENL